MRSGALAVLLAWTTTVAAQEPTTTSPPPPPPPPAAAPAQSSELELFSLESQMEQSVSTSTKTEQRAAQTPAVVTVVTAEEIQARGYTCLADVLRAIPGFYDAYDLVHHNIGVRGINGGENAAGNVIKVMIDGHPVDYRPTTGNFFGEELIPIDMVDRVEIIRGPASALYGANAFLGVVNVITKSGESIAGAHVIGQGALVRSHPGGGGGIVVGGAAGPVDVIVGANYLYLNRSGLPLPSSSPLLVNDRDNVAGRAPSQNDLARPATFFGKLSVNIAGGKLTLMGSMQYLDARGEYQSFGPLTHDTRITQLNQNYRLAYESAITERFTLFVSGHYFNAAPTEKERLDVGRTDYVMLRSVGAQGGGFTVEGRIKAHRTLTLVVGGDFVDEDHTLETYDQKLIQPVLAADGSVLRTSGTIIPGENHGAQKTFTNFGVYAQGVLTVKSDWTVVGGLRLDEHNIYGANVSARAGVVYAPVAHPLSVKLLYGSSFKAPSAEQLYSTPIGFGGLQGNPMLHAQTAHTIEAAGAYKLPREKGELSVNVFATDLLGRVEFLPTGNFVQAQNITDEWVMGGELDSRFAVARPLHIRFSAGVARTVARSAGAALLGKPEELNSLFPTYQLHLIGDWALPWWALKLSAEVSYIGARPASFSNALIKGAPYDLGGYVYTALSLSTAGRIIIPRHETSLALRVSNVINQIWTEPGFGGVDVPAQGITVFLTIVQAL
jgi:outer membrane receptor for ferrienterochelin and colicins